jgi:Arc/MetJ-type ribon-helix-helix transcriptional regulator
MKTVSFKLPPDLDNRLSELARRRRTSRSAVVREALEALSAKPKLSVTELAGDLVGCISGPSDLATNPKYLADFGKWRRS